MRRSGDTEREEKERDAVADNAQRGELSESPHKPRRGGKTSERVKEGEIVAPHSVETSRILQLGTKLTNGEPATRAQLRVGDYARRVATHPPPCSTNSQTVQTHTHTQIRNTEAQMHTHTHTHAPNDNEMQTHNGRHEHTHTHTHIGDTDKQDCARCPNLTVREPAGAQDDASFRRPPPPPTAALVPTARCAETPGNRCRLWTRTTCAEAET